jgi:2-haloacid dehalogenase
MNADQFRCLSFDCYGTIVDWETGILAALEPVLRRHGVDASGDEVLRKFADAEAAVEAQEYRRYREVLGLVLARIGDAFRFAPGQSERDAFAGSVGAWPLFADSADALRALGDRYRLIILSNVDEDQFAATRRALGVRLDAVFTAERIGSYKPSRRNFDYLIDHAGVGRHQLLHVAQSVFHDIRPARRAGLATVWVNRRRERSSSGADLTVPDLAALATRLCR